MRSSGHSSRPPYRCGAGCRATSMRVMIPNEPPPPRTAQNSSGSSVAESRARPAAVDHLDGQDTVGAEAPRAAEPADAAGDGHPDDGRVRIRSGEERQARALECGKQLARLDARTHPRAAALHVDGDLTEGTGTQQQYAGSGARGRAVAGRLGADVDTVVDGPAHRRPDVIGVLDLEDGHRPLVDVDDPCHPGLVPARVVRGVHGAHDAASQVGDGVGGVAAGLGLCGGGVRHGSTVADRSCRVLASDFRVRRARWTRRRCQRCFVTAR